MTRNEMKAPFTLRCDAFGYSLKPLAKNEEYKERETPRFKTFIHVLLLFYSTVKIKINSFKKIKNKLIEFT